MPDDYDGWVEDNDDWYYDRYDPEGDYDYDPNEDWECLFPGECLMMGFHHRSECCTVEDMQAMYEELDG